MTQHDVEQPQDLVGRAVSALRALNVPDGPSSTVAQDTVRALYRGEMHHRSGAWLIGRSFFRLAAVFLLGCCAGALAVGSLFKHPMVVVDRTTDHLDGQGISAPRGTAPHSSPVLAKTGASSPAQASEPGLPLPQFEADVAIAGHAYYLGVPPARTFIDTHACADCAKAIHEPLHDESLVVNEDSTIQNVVVSIASGLPPGERFPVPSQPVVLDQKNCRFDPHVLAAMVGQTVLIKNSDPLLHSIRSMDAEEAPSFNFAQPNLGQRQIDPFRTVETLRVKCDLHPWMTAWCRTFDHPYFCVTRRDGTFTLRGLPPGKYRLKAWHESLGVQERDVSVTDGEPAVVDFAFYPH